MLYVDFAAFNRRDLVRIFTYRCSDRMISRLSMRDICQGC